MSKSQNKKPKKEKVTYIDDGSTVVDMTGVGGARSRNTGKPPKTPKKTSAPRLLPGGHSTMKEQAQTFFGAMRMMFLPMLTAIGILTLIYLIFWFLL